MSRLTAAAPPERAMRTAFWRTLALLTLSALLIRLVSLRFNLLLTGHLGGAGMGLFSLILSVRGFAVTFSTAGVALAASRLTARALEVGGSVRRVSTLCLRYAAVMGGIAAALLLLLAPVIGRHLTGDARAVPALRAMSLSLPIIAMSAAVSGYFQAVRRAARSCLCELGEIGLRIAATLALLKLPCEPYLAIGIGMALSELLSGAWQGMLFLRDPDRRRDSDRPAARASSTTVSELLAVTLPIALSSYVRSGLLTLEHLLIPRGLNRYAALHGAPAIATAAVLLVSATDAAMARYGALSTLIFPLILLPATPIYAANSLLIPEIARADAADDRTRLEAICRRTVCAVFPYAIGVATLILCLAPLLGGYLAGESATAAVSGLLLGAQGAVSASASLATPPSAAASITADLLCLAPLVPVMYLDSVFDAMLKGLGDSVFCMGVNIADAALSTLLVLILLPRMGIAGYLLTLIVSELLNATLSLSRLLLRVPMRIPLLRTVLLPLLASTVIGVAAALLR